MPQQAVVLGRPAAAAFLPFRHRFLPLSARDCRELPSPSHCPLSSVVPPAPRLLLRVPFASAALGPLRASSTTSPFATPSPSHDTSPPSKDRPRTHPFGLLALAGIVLGFAFGDPKVYLIGVSLMVWDGCAWFKELVDEYLCLRYEERIASMREEKQVAQVYLSHKKIGNRLEEYFHLIGEQRKALKTQWEEHTPGMGEIEQKEAEIYLLYKKIDERLDEYLRLIGEQRKASKRLWEEHVPDIGESKEKEAEVHLLYKKFEERLDEYSHLICEQRKVSERLWEEHARHGESKGQR